MILVRRLTLMTVAIAAIAHAAPASGGQSGRPCAGGESGYGLRGDRAAHDRGRHR